MSTRLFAKTGLSLERLQTFVEIISAKGISSAAPGDNNRQSQFSRQLKELEEFFGAELLLRGHGRCELTPAGRELFQIVQSHFSALQQFADRCAKNKVEVNIGAGESVLQWLLLPSLARLRKELPLATFTLHNLQTDEIAARLRDGRLDLGIGRQEACLTPLKCARLGMVEYRLGVPKGLLRGKGDAWALIARHPMALLAGSEVTQALERVAEKRKLQLNVFFRGTSYTQLVEAVRSVGCVAVLPSFISQAHAGAGVEFVPLNDLKEHRRTLSLAWNPRFCALRPAMPPVTETVAATLQSALESSGGSRAR